MTAIAHEPKLREVTAKSSTPVGVESPVEVIISKLADLSHDARGVLRAEFKSLYSAKAPLDFAVAEKAVIDVIAKVYSNENLPCPYFSRTEKSAIADAAHELSSIRREFSAKNTSQRDEARFAAFEQVEILNARDMTGKPSTAWLADKLAKLPAGDKAAVLQLAEKINADLTSGWVPATKLLENVSNFSLLSGANLTTNERHALRLFVQVAEACGQGLKFNQKEVAKTIGVLTLDLKESNPTGRLLAISEFTGAAQGLNVGQARSSTLSTLTRNVAEILPQESDKLLGSADVVFPKSNTDKVVDGLKSGLQGVLRLGRRIAAEVTEKVADLATNASEQLKSFARSAIIRIAAPGHNLPRYPGEVEPVVRAHEKVCSGTALVATLAASTLASSVRAEQVPASESAAAALVTARVSSPSDHFHHPIRLAPELIVSIAVDRAVAKSLAAARESANRVATLGAESEAKLALLSAEIPEAKVPTPVSAATTPPVPSNYSATQVLAIARANLHSGVEALPDKRVLAEVKLVIDAALEGIEKGLDFDRSAQQTFIRLVNSLLGTSGVSGSDQTPGPFNVDFGQGVSAVSIYSPTIMADLLDKTCSLVAESLSLQRGDITRPRFKFASEPFSLRLIDSEIFADVAHSAAQVVREHKSYMRNEMWQPDFVGRLSGRPSQFAESINRQIDLLTLPGDLGTKLQQLVTTQFAGFSKSRGAVSTPEQFVGKLSDLVQPYSTQAGEFPHLRYCLLLAQGKSLLEAGKFFLDVHGIYGQIYSKVTQPSTRKWRKAN